MDRNDGQLDDAAAFFRSRDIPIRRDWLTSTIAHVTTSGQKGTVDLRDHVIRHFLQSDLRVSTEATCVLPKEDNAVLARNTLVQVIDCQEIGFSLAHQLERLDDYKERQKPVNRRLIRLPDNEVDDAETSGETTTAAATAVDLTTPSTSGPTTTTTTTTTTTQERMMIGKKMCKVVLEDASGARLYGIESRDVPGLFLGMLPGAKVMLRPGVRIVHGVALLTPAKLEWLGGAFRRLADREDAEGLRTRLTAELGKIQVMTPAERERLDQNHPDDDEERTMIDDDDDDDDDEGRRRRNDGQGRGTRYRGRGGRGRARGGAGRAMRSRGRATTRGRS